MYGGSGKLGRGGSGGGGRGGGGGGGSNSNSKRNNHHSSYPPPPLHRSIPPQSNRLPIRNNRQPNNNTKGHVPAQSNTTTTTEENYNLVSGDPPLAFAMIIRLAPNLVDEIQRVEADGGTARIKFDPYGNTPDENVIDVGGKDFRFTWSHEPGDLCDIYEERKNGENGNGLLVESGGAWRKLNVHRVLDESMKNHVKMRSEEAERKQKSRRAIVLDHGNPSTAAGEGRMTSKSRNEPPLKKRKVEPVQGNTASGGPPKSVFKPGLSSTTTFKGRPSVSPVPSPPEQSRPSASPLGRGNLLKSHITSEDVIASNVTNKEEILNIAKERGNRVVHAAVPPGNKELLTPPDLRSSLITLLKENPKGLNFKALEKAIGDPTMKIKPILEKVATYQAPGRYILKEGVELESQKISSADIGSSPECVPDQTENLDKASPDKFDTQSRLTSQTEVSKFVEKIDNQHNLSDVVVDKKASDHHNEEHAATSVESGSDSDSDSSSDSESDSSDSESQSKSRSPAKSGSGSSDSESDGSLSNKEGSDVDVDIMSEDEREQTEHKMKSHDGALSSPPFQTEIQNRSSGLNEDKQVGHEYGATGFSKGLTAVSDEDELVDVIGSPNLRATVISSQATTPFSPDRDRRRESEQFFPGYLNNQRQDINDGVDLKNYESSERTSSSVVKSDIQYEKSESARRLERGSSAQPLTSGRNKETTFVESPNYVSPNRAPQDFSKDRTRQGMERVGDAILDTSSQRNFGPPMHGRSNSDAQLSSQRYADQRSLGNAPDVMERSRKSVPGRGHKSFGRPGFQDESDGSANRSTHAYDKFSADKDKVNREAPDEGHAYENSLNKDVREGILGNKKSMLSKSQHRRQGELAEKSKDTGQTTHSHSVGFPKDDSRVDVERLPVANGRGSSLRREPSDLEVGEFREPTHREDNQVSTKKLEKKNSFKQSESMSNVPYQFSSDPNMGRAAPKMNQESRRQLTPDSGAGVLGYQDDLYWKRNVGDNIEESTRPQQVFSVPDVQQFPTDEHTDFEIGYEHLNKPANGGTKARKKDARKSQEVGSQSNGSTFRKASDNVTQQRDTQNEHQKMSPKPVKESKSRKSNAGLLLKNKDPILTENNNISQKRRESSPNEALCVYFKYEKDEPELKGPIKDFSQYKQYAEEFREKYDSYCSINKIIEANRIDFNKLGQDLQLAKHRDVEEYHRILEQLRENYRHSGRTHKRLKKIFVVLHEELGCLKKIIKEFAVSYNKD